MNNLVFKLLSVILFISIEISAIEINGSLAKMPLYAESTEKGILVDLVKAIEEVSENKIDIKVLPFASSLIFVEYNKKDFHIPLIKNNIVDTKNLKYHYSTDTLFHVNFVIYSLKDKNINVDNISNFKVETDRAHINYFPFKIIASNSIKKSLERINSGEIDAFIFADFATDPFLKQIDNKNIKREFYERFEVKAVFQKNKRGKKIDQVFISGLAELRKTGKLNKIIGQLDDQYNNWQP